MLSTTTERAFKLDTTHHHNNPTPAVRPPLALLAQFSLFISYWINLQTSLFCDIHNHACFDERSRENRWRNFGKFLILLRLFLALIPIFFFVLIYSKHCPLSTVYNPPPSILLDYVVLALLFYTLIAYAYSLNTICHDIIRIYCFLVGKITPTEF